MAGPLILPRDVEKVIEQLAPSRAAVAAVTVVKSGSELSWVQSYSKAWG